MYTLIIYCLVFEIYISEIILNLFFCDPLPPTSWLVCWFVSFLGEDLNESHLTKPGAVSFWCPPLLPIIFWSFLRIYQQPQRFLLLFNVSLYENTTLYLSILLWVDFGNLSSLTITKKKKKCCNSCFPPSFLCTHPRVSLQQIPRNETSGSQTYWTEQH